MGQEEDKVRILPISESLEVEDEGAEVRVGVVGRWEEVCSPQVLHLHLHLHLHLQSTFSCTCTCSCTCTLTRRRGAPPAGGGEGGARDREVDTTSTPDTKD